MKLGAYFLNPSGDIVEYQAITKAIVAIVAMGDGLGMRVIADAVETRSKRGVLEGRHTYRSIIFYAAQCG